MNNDRRKQISAVYKRMEELNELIELINTQAEDIKGDLKSIRDEEQEYYDNIPESLQGGDKCQAAEQAVQHLDEAMKALDGLIDLETLESAMEALDKSTDA